MESGSYWEPQKKIHFDLLLNIKQAPSLSFFTTRLIFIEKQLVTQDILAFYISSCIFFYLQVFLLCIYCICF